MTTLLFRLIWSLTAVIILPFLAFPVAALVYLFRGMTPAQDTFDAFISLVESLADIMLYQQTNPSSIDSSGPPASTAGKTLSSDTGSVTPTSPPCPKPEKTIQIQILGESDFSTFGPLLASIQIYPNGSYAVMDRSGLSRRQAQHIAQALAQYIKSFGTTPSILILWTQGLDRLWQISDTRGYRSVYILRRSLW